MSDMAIYRQSTAWNKNAGRRFCGLFAGEYQEDDPRVGCELLDPLFPLGLWKLAKVAAVRLSTKLSRNSGLLTRQINRSYDCAY